MTDCPYTDRVDAFHDQSTGDHEAEWMAEHVRACPACAERLRQLRDISAAFAAFEPEGMPTESKANLIATMKRAADRAPARFAWEMTGLAASVLVAATIWLATLPASAEAVGTWEQAAATGGTSLQSEARHDESDFAARLVSELSSTSATDAASRQEQPQ